MWLLWKERVGTCSLKTESALSPPPQVRSLGVVTQTDLAIENLYPASLKLFLSKFTKLNLKLKL